MSTGLVLVSHVLCPYVQRVAIVLLEKGVPFERRYIDLANKPDWFTTLSPTGKTPLLLVGEVAIFESSVICEYLEETRNPSMHPADPLARARHRGWMELSSRVLASIAALYSAETDEKLAAACTDLRNVLERFEHALGAGPYFAGDRFSMVDAAFAPALRYFKVFEEQAGLELLQGYPQLAEWRSHLFARRSVIEAVTSDYHALLERFLLDRGSAVSRRMCEKRLG